MKAHARKLAHAAASSWVYFVILWLPDRIIDMLTRKTTESVVRSEKLLLAATGGGNIGDQALLESYLACEPGPITVICRSLSDVSIPDSCVGRVTLKPLPRLLSPVPLLRLPDMARFRLLVKKSSSFALIGADLMDGLYNPGASISRASLLKSAAHLGCESRALGFSWPERPTKYSLRAIRSAGATARLYARDPLSFSRLESMNVSGIRLAADIVFAFKGSTSIPAVAELVERARKDGMKLAVVNISALIEARLRQAPEYEKILLELASRGYAIVVAPHVIRKSGNDLTAARRVLDATQVPYYLIDRLMTPSESRWLAGISDIIVTGRMHLAVLGMSQNVPTITLGTQGKVEGLYRHFKLTWGVVAPRIGFGEEVANQIALITDSHREFSTMISAERDRVHELACANFA